MANDFELPQVYSQDGKSVMESLRKGEIDYAAMSKWQFPDEFFCFVLEAGFLEFVERSYPTPREKEEVPIWFLMSCQLLMRLCLSTRYEQLKHFLNAGSVLTRVGFNVADPSIGFNEKNKKPRKTAADSDTVRKFFKDTDPQEIRNWYNESVQGWFRGKRAFEDRGLFILDQTHLVVPDNPNYKGAIRLPVDEHGQWYPNYKKFTEEQKKALPHHPCYALSLLLHANPMKDLFHIAGYEFGPGSEDELVQAKRLLPDFCRVYRGIMKELIVDRGYVDGGWVGKMKKDYGVDILVPLKAGMADFEDAIGIAERQGQWKITESEKDTSGKLIKETHTAEVMEMDLWEACPLKLHVYVSKTKRWNVEKQAYDSYTWALAATKKYPTERAAIERYGLRTQVEERNRQLKLIWQVAKFTSPAPGLMESHVCFTLLTYSLLQLYLRRNDLRTHTQRTLSKWQQQERLNGDTLLVYAGQSFSTMKLMEFAQVLIGLDEQARNKIRAMQPTPQGGMQRIGY